MLFRLQSCRSSFNVSRSKKSPSSRYACPLFEQARLCCCFLHWLSLQRSAAELIEHPHPVIRRMTSSKKGKRKEVSRIHGQRTIDSDRAAQIQTALIHQKYLTGTPTGQWDAQTQVAMRQYQSDHGWQTKLTPDSRALISLGLGPNHTQDPAIGRTLSEAALRYSKSNQLPGRSQLSRQKIHWPLFIPFRSRCFAAGGAKGPGNSLGLLLWEAGPAVSLSDFDPLALSPDIQPQN